MVASDSLTWLGTMQRLRGSYLGVRLVWLLANGLLLAGLALGLYCRWTHSQDMAVLFIAFLGLFVFAVASALVYYFSMETVGYSLSRLWVGCLLGVISFPDVTVLSHDGLQSAASARDVLLLASLVIHCLGHVIERVINTSKPTHLVSKMDGLEMIGMATSSIATGKDYISISLLTLALFVTMTTIQTKSFMGLINLIVFVTVSGLLFFPKLLEMQVNGYAMWCFLGRVAFEPISDLYFSSQTTLERWSPLFQKSRLAKRLLILAVFAIQMTFWGVNAKQIPGHKEWLIVVPIFAAFSVLWVCYHLVFLVTCWQLANKVSDCCSTYRSLEESSRNMHRILASKGVRHFSLISQRLVGVTLVTTILIAGVSWTTKTSVSISLWLIVLPLEVAVVSLLWEMGATLGGTCTGYAVVAPATFHSPGRATTVLPPTALQELSSRATFILNAVQAFFSFHLIDTYGCDFSSSGLTAESLETKLRNFFQQLTAAGPRFDTYLVFYSGPVHDNGDWALAGSERLSLDTLTKWWQESDVSAGTRLILVLDTQASRAWLKPVRRLGDGVVVGLQTCVVQEGWGDVEEGASGGTGTGPGPVRLGDFTADWMDLNSAGLRQVDFHDPGRALRAAYSVSQAWTDFTFHLPTHDDIERHWDDNFPRVTKPLIKVTNFPKIGSAFFCCDCLLRCLKRKKMRWLPPRECDTGHGFKLIRS